MRRMKSLGRILGIYVVMTLTAFSQSVNYETDRFNRIITAIRVTEEIRLDGNLDEPAWMLATPASSFTQWSPQPGLPSPERTEVRILYDDDNLYIGALCFDSDAANIVVNELKEDYQPEDTDSLHLYIDSLHDRRSGFLIGTTPVGAKRDAQISDAGQLNVDWDGVWDSKTTINEDGWFAEIVIPFKTLRFKNADLQEWGLNISRRIRRRNETSYWAPIPVRYRATNLELAGTLKGLENIRQGRNLKIKPFVTAGITQVRVGDEMETLRSLANLKDYDGGVDLKYGITPSVTLDATYRTDFAQVEADQQQVNLTRFNLFFPEKRDFFLENAGVFSFGPGGNMLPFFSRSIGLAPAGTAIPAGTPVPIVGGSRVTGQLGNYNVGFLAMKTEALTTETGSLPSNNYLVGRIRRSLLSNSWIGGIVTSRDSTQPGDYNRAYGTDAHFRFDKLSFDSYVLQTDTPGRSGKNQARRFQSGWVGDELVLNAEYNEVQTNFSPQVGFVRRGNMLQYAGDFSWLPRLQGSSIRNLRFGTSLDYYEGGSTGKIETRTHSATAGMLLQNEGSFDFTVNRTFDRLLSAARIQGISIPPGDYQYTDYSVRFSTDASEKISGNANVAWGEFWDGHRRSLSGGVAVKPTYRMSMDFTYNRNRVELLNGTSTSNLAGARFIYGLSPRSFLNAFFQYNGSTHEVSTNIRFNIMYRPLSDLYLVYNDRRNTQTDQVMERAFIVKLTNLFNF